MIDETERGTSKEELKDELERTEKNKASKVGKKVRLRGKVIRKRRSRIFKKARRKEDTRISKLTWRRKKN